MPKAETHISRLDWSGRVVAVQPRIRLMRSFDERHHLGRASYRWNMRRPYRRVSYRRRHGGAREAPVLHRDGSERFLNPGGRPALRGGRILQDERHQNLQGRRNRNIWDTAIPGSTPRPGNLSQQGPSPTGHQDLRKEMHNLHLGLPDAGGNDHRPLESVSEAVPVRDLLLRAEKLFPLPGRGNAQGARAEKACLTPKKTGLTRTLPRTVSRTIKMTGDLNLRQTHHMTCDVRSKLWSETAASDPV